MVKSNVWTALQFYLNEFLIGIVKDRQQEVTAVLVALRYIGDHCMPLDIQYMYHISLMTLFQGLSIDIKHVKIARTKTKLTKNECENLKFFLYFLNKDISLNISSICLKFSMHVDGGHLEGSVSQNFHLGPSFHFMHSRKKSLKK